MRSNCQIFNYNSEFVTHDENITLDKLNVVHDGTAVRWINFHGFENKALIHESFEHHGVHKLTREDILQLTERPKIEEYDSYIYVTLKSVYTKKDKYHKIQSEQISFILTHDTVISYQERHGDLYGYVRDRILNDTGIVRKKGADYLLYLLIEATLIGYEKCTEHLNTELVELKECMRHQLSNELFSSIEERKDEIQLLRKSFHPFRDQAQKLTNSSGAIIKETTIPFFNDIRDNVLYISDETDDTKAELESLTNLYFARLSQKSNEIMQFLTIVAAIFIPLTFVAGVYGMNFKYMPELTMKYGYFVIWGVMISIAVGLVFYFKKKKWF